TLRLYYYGQADTDNSIVVHVPEEGVLVTGDLYWSGGVFSYFGDGLNLEIPRWIEVLDTVLEDANGLRWVVSGHRHIWPGEHLVLLRRYIAELWAAVREAKGAGSGLEETQRRLTAGRFPYLDRLGFDAFLAEEEQQRRNVAAFWRQLQISAADEVERALAEAGPEAAAARFEAVRADPSDGYYLDEDEFNSLGYRLIRAASLDAAVAVLRINVELFPESWNVHDSLGEAYAFAGQPENARESFGRSLKLNPDNRNSRQWLQRLDANAAAAATATATARPISESAGSLVLRRGPQQLPNVFTYQVGLGDLDGDGDLDAAFANMRLNESRIWMNDGSGRLVDSGQALTRQGHGVGVGDLDGDGDLDLFITCAGYGEGGISYRKPSRVYLNDGRGLFTDSGQDLGDTELSGNHVTLIDVDLDRDLDAHVVYYGEPDAVYLNDGKARFSRSERVVPEGATFGDLDGDGDLDVFVRNVGSGYESRLRDGEGGLREHWRLASADVAFGHVVLADLDGDGDADAFVTSGIRETASPARVLLNDGAGAFFDSGQRLGLTDGGGLAAGDLDSDGDIDVFLSRKQRTNEIWLNDGDGRFTGLRLEHSDPTTIPSLGDLDGDGDLDLVVGSFGGRAQVWLNGGIDKSESSAPSRSTDERGSSWSSAGTQ
ncbi:MAG: hypothetical protein GY925_26765, partial [Actinomycetia bacterium]|nr:hypothetical protein [Actinomycetes bacterium]